MSYVDGAVIAVPAANREACRSHSGEAAKVFKAHGALRIAKCRGHNVPEGEVTLFPMAVQRRPAETVVFFWIMWPSRKVREELKAMAEPGFNPTPTPCPSTANA